jgi:hypothetical protein
MALLLTKKGFAVHPNRIPRFGARLGLASVGSAQKNPVGLVATVFPEFIARDGQERADGGRQGEKRRGGAARSRPRRGHGPARLDGTRTRATVADKVMKSRKDGSTGNGRRLRQSHASEARSAAGAKASAMEAEGARRQRRLDAQHDSAARLRRETPWLAGTREVREVPWNL